MPSPLIRHWTLDPAITFLNHGSFGACPRPVLEAQQEYRARLESEPVRFLARELDGHLAIAREALGAFVGADPDDLAFVANATGAINAVLRSLSFEPGDELLTTDHEYNATINVLRHVAGLAGARVVVARIPFPLRSVDEAADQVLGAVTDRTRLAFISHVSSPTALVLPVERLVPELAARGIDTFVDGAHAPGMLPLDLAALGAAWYAGNLHKWVCAPKGSGFLHAPRERQPGIRPGTISHGANEPAGRRSRFRAEFDWQGTLDPTAWLAVPEAIRFVGGLVPGGWPEVMARSHALTLAARAALAPVLGARRDDPAPDSMLGAMVALPLPAHGPLASDAAAGGSSPLDSDPLQDRLFAEDAIEVPIFPWPVPAAESPDPPRRLMRVSTPIYLDESDTGRLTAALARIAGQAGATNTSDAA